MQHIQVTDTLSLTVHDADNNSGPAVVIRRTDGSDEQVTIYAKEIRHLVAKLPEGAVLMVGGIISVDDTHSGNGGGSSWAEP